jgi:hypothetical protein
VRRDASKLTLYSLSSSPVNAQHADCTSPATELADAAALGPPGEESMSQLRFTARSLLVLSALAAGCHVGMPMPVEESFHVEFDSRPWVKVFDGTEGRDAIMQYVPTGSSADNWSEMITTRSFPGLQATSTPDQAMGDKRKLAEERCAKVDWAVVGQEPDSIRYTATYGGCTEERPPHEVGRFVKSSLAMYLVTYQSKKATFTAEEAKHWADILARAGYGDQVLERDY